jgi:hypothetical protein
MCDDESTCTHSDVLHFMYGTYTATALCLNHHTQPSDGMAVVVLSFFEQQQKLLVVCWPFPLSWSIELEYVV